MTEPALTRAAERRPRASSVAGAVDGVALLALVSVAALGLEPAWGDLTFAPAAVGGALAGLLVAWVAAWQRWGVALTAGVATLVYFLLGGALALPATTVGGVLPTVSTWNRLAVGLVEGWKDFVTAVPPLLSFPGLAVVPYALCYVAAVVAGTIAWRARVGGWALVPVLLAAALIASLGTVVATYPVLQGLATAVIGILWASWRAASGPDDARELMSDRSRGDADRRRWRRLAAGALILGVTGTAAAQAAPRVVEGERAVLREVIVPPLDLYEYTSPLVAFRKYAKDQAEDELFTVDGLHAGDRVRLAALDRYSGVVYDASSGEGGGVYHRVGGSIDSLAPGERRPVDVSVTGYSGVWLPLVGELTSLRFDGPRSEALADAAYYNAQARSGLVAAGVGAGDRYSVDVVVAPAPTEDQLRSAAVADVELPDPLDVPEGALAKAQQFAADAVGPYAQVVAIRDTLEATGISSSGLENQAPSRAGHSTARLDEMLAQAEMVGDDEQFASVLALMLRQRDIPAQVVMGFVPDPDVWVPGTPYVARGADVRAWVEVPFDGLGWVAFDVEPDEDNQVEPEPRSQEVPKPPVLDSPQRPDEPPEPESADVEDEDRDEEEAAAFPWRQVAVVLAAVVVPLGVLLAPFLLVLAYKAVRHRRRRSSEEVLDRFSGGWREVLDTATDLGAGVPRSATRREAAQHVAGQIGDGPDTLLLAEGADRALFGSADIGDEVATVYWEHVDEVLEAMRRSVPWHRRLASRVSLRSVRRAERPVVSGTLRERLTALVALGPAGWSSLAPLVRRRS